VQENRKSAGEQKKCRRMDKARGDMATPSPLVKGLPEVTSFTIEIGVVIGWKGWSDLYDNINEL